MGKPLGTLATIPFEIQERQFKFMFQLPPKVIQKYVN